MSDDCLFCKIIAGDIPSDQVYVDDQVVAFKDVNPQAPFHALVVPKQHISTTNDLDKGHEALIGHMALTATKIAAENDLAEPGYRMIMNCNAEGGQTVYHIHLHVMGGRQLRGLG